MNRLLSLVVSILLVFALFSTAEGADKKPLVLFAPPINQSQYPVFTPDTMLMWLERINSYNTFYVKHEVISRLEVKKCAGYPRMDFEAVKQCALHNGAATAVYSVITNVEMSEEAAKKEIFRRPASRSQHTMKITYGPVSFTVQTKTIDLATGKVKDESITKNVAVDALELQALMGLVKKLEKGSQYYFLDKGVNRLFRKNAEEWNIPGLLMDKTKPGEKIMIGKNDKAFGISHHIAFQVFTRAVPEIIYHREDFADAEKTADDAIKALTFFKSINDWSNVEALSKVGGALLDFKRTKEEILSKLRAFIEILRQLLFDLPRDLTKVTGRAARDVVTLKIVSEKGYGDKQLLTYRMQEVYLTAYQQFLFKLAEEYVRAIAKIDEIEQVHGTLEALFGIEGEKNPFERIKLTPEEQ